MGVRDGYLAIAGIAYAGIGAWTGQPALDIVRERWAEVHHRDPEELRFDLQGQNSLRPWRQPVVEPSQERAASRWRTFDATAVTILHREVEALYTNGTGRRRRGGDEREADDGHRLDPDRSRARAAANGDDLVSHLYDIAHARAGDKGDTSIIVVAPYEIADFDRVGEALDSDAVAAASGSSGRQRDDRPSPTLGAFTVVIRERLDGGVTRSRSDDPHGKSLSGHILEMSTNDR